MTIDGFVELVQHHRKGNIVKNTAELRSFLISRMEGLASGKESIAQSHAIAALAKQINTTLSLEIAASRILKTDATSFPALAIK